MTAHTYRSRPTDVDAIQWRGDNLDEIQAWTGIRPSTEMPVAYESGILGSPSYSLRLWVQANQQYLPLVVGEWILRDHYGFYPCHDDVFTAKYDRLLDTTEAAELAHNRTEVHEAALAAADFAFTLPVHGSAARRVRGAIAAYGHFSAHPALLDDHVVSPSVVDVEQFLAERDS